MTIQPSLTLIRANNPGPMTLQGTNTYVLRASEGAGAVVVDPGPDDEAHLNAVLTEATKRGGRVELVLFTHWHEDHTESIDRFCDMSGAPARAFDAAYCRGAEPVTDGETITIDGLELQVLHTPGHTADSICVLLPHNGTLLTGDTILGESTTVIAHPDGNLASYLHSLELLHQLTVSGQVREFSPAHGPAVTDPQQVIETTIAHRNDRLQQVRDAVAAGDQTAREVVERVYANVDRSLWQAAEWSVRAQLEYLGVKE